jgi:hypothetical protein
MGEPAEPLLLNATPTVPLPENAKRPPRIKAVSPRLGGSPRA